MEEKSSKGRGMISSFHDEDIRTDYDKDIAQARIRMSGCDPCKNLSEIDTLTARLYAFRNRYYTRPCIEGFCFGIFTPHTSRIARRIEDLNNERKAHEEDCKIFQRDHEEKVQRSENEKDRQARIEIEKAKIEAAKGSIIHKQTSRVEKGVIRL